MRFLQKSFQRVEFTCCAKLTLTFHPWCPLRLGKAGQPPGVKTRLHKPNIETENTFKKPPNTICLACIFSKPRPPISCYCRTLKPVRPAKPAHFCICTHVEVRLQDERSGCTGLQDFLLS